MNRTFFLVLLFLTSPLWADQPSPKIVIFLDDLFLVDTQYDYTGGDPQIDKGVWLRCGVGEKGEHDGVSHTPKGKFKVIYKAKDPIYVDVHGKLIAGPFKTDLGNVYGTRIIGLSYIRHGRHLCIHGTNEPELIPGYVSHMCIRLRNEDVEWLYDRVQIGDEVDIR